MSAVYNKIGINLIWKNFGKIWFLLGARLNIGRVGTSKKAIAWMGACKCKAGGNFWRY